jgi:putative phage-type endonuclease
MRGSRWVIIDTETDGLTDPIHVVELSGQIMDGWEPVGEPFQMLLNHNVPIPPEATAIHGYTEDYLREHGHKPSHVYEAFREYAQDFPLVAHNLSYDWNRCLIPEWSRLGVPQVGQRGFCCMMLARRLVPEVSSYRLDALKKCFRLSESRSHQAKNDVLTVVELFQKVYRQRLESAGFDTFDSVAAFAKRTPVAKCLDIIRGAGMSAPEKKALKDAWFYLDANKNDHGPFSALQVRQSAGPGPYYIWRDGMSDWVVAQEHAEFLALCELPPVIESPGQKHERAKTMSELVILCQGLVADNIITTEKVMFLNSWLQDVGFITEWPASQIAQTLERILEDGIVTEAEKEELKRLLQKIATAYPAASEQISMNDSLVPVDTNLPFIIVELEQGEREWLEWRQKGIGASDAPAILGENPWKSARDILAEKCGGVVESGQNAAMARGTQLEPEARRRYMAATGNEVKPACIQSKSYDWLRASVDGISISREALVEIKCGESVYRKVSRSGQVPDYYVGQLQHILAVTGFKSIDFWCYLPNCPELLVTVSRDDRYIEHLIKKEFEFWGIVQQMA